MTASLAGAGSDRPPSGVRRLDRRHALTGVLLTVPALASYSAGSGTQAPAYPVAR